jgi:S1-C subfamily serine protease
VNRRLGLLLIANVSIALVTVASLSVKLDWSVEGSASRARNSVGCIGEIERSITEVYRRVSPSVVQVMTFSGVDTAATFEAKTASGFVWDTSGNIVTNEHVVRGASVIVFWLSSGARVEAEVAGVAVNHDLAVIRPKKALTLPPPIPIGSSNDLEVGQFAYAIGSPFGLDQSLTVGVISALKRQLPTDDGGMITQIIQTDAAIHRGNSGGPLLDSTGRLVGVNTISYATTDSHAALGFAIPVDLVKRVVPELIGNRGRPRA